MKKTVFVFYLFFIATNLFAQTSDSLHKKHSFFVGAGNYEYLHLGYNYSFKQKHYAEIAAGIKPWAFKNSNYQMVYLCLGTKLFKKRSFLFTPNVHLKCLLWKYTNDYNKFIVVGINPEFRLSKAFKNIFTINLNAGVLYNAPVYYKRKTYLEVGWPKEWQPSFSLQINYFIK